MTLWHLLYAVGLLSPFAAALIAGVRTEIGTGIAFSLLVGVGLALCSGWAMHTLGYRVYQRTRRMTTEAAKDGAIGLLYVGMFVWGYAAGFIALKTTGAVLSYLSGGLRVGLPTS